MKFLRVEAAWAIAQLRFWQVRMMEGRIELSKARTFTSLGKVGKSGWESMRIIDGPHSIWITNLGCNIKQQ